MAGYDRGSIASPEALIRLNFGASSDCSLLKSAHQRGRYTTETRRGPLRVQTSALVATSFCTGRLHPLCPLCLGLAVCSAVLVI
jgi:hypothetical protein